MKKITLSALMGMLFIPTFFFSCYKEKTVIKENIEIKDTPVAKSKPDSCATVSSKGRIIGYDPCRYYTPVNKRKDAGFVIEIDNGITKDTVVNYSIPEDLFQFPYINTLEAIAGQFLYPQDIQEKFHIKFNYRVALDSEKTFYPCIALVWVVPFVTATKGKQIFITCISAQ